VSNLSRRDQGVATAASVRFMAQSLVWTFAGDLSAKAAVLLTVFIAVRAFASAGFGQDVTLSATALLAAALWDAGGLPTALHPSDAGHEAAIVENPARLAGGPV
jgi:hypothetical protein